MNRSGFSFLLPVICAWNCTVAELDCRSEDPQCFPAIAPVLLFGSCSQSSGQLISLAAEDGTVTDSPATTATSGGIVNIGDLAGGATTQFFLSFDLSLLQGGFITSATVSVYQGGSNGTPANIVPFFVDHVDFGTLDNSDHGTASLTQGFHEINDVSPATFKTFDVTPFIQADLLAGRTRSQYRIRAITNSDASADSLALSTGDSGSNQPTLNYNACL